MIIGPEPGGVEIRHCIPNWQVTTMTLVLYLVRKLTHRQIAWSINSQRMVGSGPDPPHVFSGILSVMMTLDVSTEYGGIRALLAH
jgi:hypothetical protein